MRHWRSTILFAGLLSMGCASSQDLHLRHLRDNLVASWRQKPSPYGRFYEIRAAYLRRELNADQLPGLLATASEDKRAFIETYYDLLAEWILQLSAEMDRAWNEGRYATAPIYADLYLLFEGSEDTQETVIEDHLKPPTKTTRVEIARHIIARYEQMFPAFQWANRAKSLHPDIASGIERLWWSRSGFRRNFAYRDRESMVERAVMSGAPVITVSAGMSLKDKLTSQALPPSASEAAKYKQEMEAIQARVLPRIAEARAALDSMRMCTTTPITEIVRENYARREKDGRMTRALQPGDATHIEKTTIRFGGDTVCSYSDPARAKALDLEIRALQAERPADRKTQYVEVVDPKRSTGSFWVTVKMGETSWDESFSEGLYGKPEERESKLARIALDLYEKALNKLAEKLEPPWLSKLAPGVSPEDREREIQMFRDGFDHFETGEELTYSGHDIQTLIDLGRLLPE